MRSGTLFALVSRWPLLATAGFKVLHARQFARDGASGVSIGRPDRSLIALHGMRPAEQTPPSTYRQGCVVPTHAVDITQYSWLSVGAA
jgi:hypothetical protein